MKFYVKKGAALLALVGVGVAYGANPCSNSNFTAILSKNAGPGCTAQAAQSAISCLQNTCLQGALQLSAPLSSSQLNCFSQSCAGTICALSNNQVSTNFMNQYNTQAQKCKQVAGSNTLSQAAQNELQFANWVKQSEHEVLLLVANLVYSFVDQTPSWNDVGSVTTRFGQPSPKAFFAQAVSDYYSCYGKNACLSKLYILNTSSNFSTLAQFLRAAVAAVITDVVIPLALQQPATDAVFAYLINNSGSFSSLLQSGQTPLTNLMRSVGWTSGTGGTGELMTISQKAKDLGIVTS